MKPIRVLAVTFLLCACATTSSDGLGDAEHPEPAQAPANEEQGERKGQAGFEEVPQFGGENSVGGQLKADDEITETIFRYDADTNLLKPYFHWKARLNEDHALALRMDYTGLWFGASEDLGGRPGADRRARPTGRSAWASA